MFLYVHVHMYVCLSVCQPVETNRVHNRVWSRDSQSVHVLCHLSWPVGMI